MKSNGPDWLILTGEVLGDSAETPRFIETLSRRGYRFIAPVESELSLVDQTQVNQDPIIRLRTSDRKIEEVAEISKVGRDTAGT